MMTRHLSNVTALPLLVLLLLLPTDGVSMAPPTPRTVQGQGVHPPCIVCGEGKEVDGTLFPPGIINIPEITYYNGRCKFFQTWGQNGNISPLNCLALPNLISAVCGCMPIATSSPSMSPNAKAAKVPKVPKTNVGIVGNFQVQEMKSGGSSMPASSGIGAILILALTVALGTF